MSTLNGAGITPVARPARIQRERVKGWRMPAAAIYVGRPTMFGNPWNWKHHGRDVAMERYRNWLLNGENCGRAWLDEVRAKVLEALPDLRGRALACFCREGEPCHADILIALANAPVEQVEAQQCQAK